MDTIPRRGDKFKLTVPLTRGSSFLINPAPVLTDKSTNPIYLAQYIKLAARRDLFLYRQYKLKHLDLSLFPDINLDNIKHNPFINVSGSILNFYYE